MIPSLCSQKKAKPPERWFWPLFVEKRLWLRFSFRQTFLEVLCKEYQKTDLHIPELIHLIATSAQNFSAQPHALNLTCWQYAEWPACQSVLTGVFPANSYFKKKRKKTDGFIGRHSFCLREGILDIVFRKYHFCTAPKEILSKTAQYLHCMYSVELFHVGCVVRGWSSIRWPVSHAQTQECFWTQRVIVTQQYNTISWAQQDVAGFGERNPPTPHRDHTRRIDWSCQLFQL